MAQRCMACMELMQDYEVCPHCGWVEGTPPAEPCHLWPGTQLHNRYTVGMSIGFGGFGITYIAWDAQLNRRVAIKEFFPVGLVNRSPGTLRVAVYTGDRELQFQQHKRRFIAEARTMAKLSGSANIVEVSEYFEENNTAYIVMEYLDGITLKEYIKQCGGKLELEVALSILMPVCEALEAVHKEGIVHRDIAPDNVMLTADNRIKLMDFGAARLSRGEDEKTMTIILKPGYAPPEQYRTRSRQGPFTDVYALGAMFYRMITGVVPEESTDRVIKDELKPPTEIVPDLPEFIDNVILRAMALNADVRFRTVREFWTAIVGEKKVEPPKQRLHKLRMMRILAAALALVLMVGVCTYVYIANTRLLPATLEVWLPVYGGESRMDDALQQLFSKEENSNESIVLPFCEENEAVTVNVTYIPAEEYHARIQEAAQLGTVPDIFIVEEYTKELDEYTVPFNQLMHDLGAKAGRDYYALGEYEQYFPNKRCLPTGIRTSLVYFNERINSVQDVGLSQKRVSIDEFESALKKAASEAAPLGIGDRESLTMLAMLDGAVDEAGYDAGARAMLVRAYGWCSEQKKTVEAMFPKAENIGDKNSESLFCYVADVSEYMQAQKYLPGYCGIAPLPGTGAYPMQFSLLWCVGDNGSANQSKAAQRLLAKLLGEQAQMILNVEAAATLPISRSAAENYYFPIFSQMGFLKPYLDDAAYVGEGLQAARMENEEYKLILGEGE